MAICSSGSPAHCCQPAVAGGVIYADLWGEFNTHLALQALFTQSSPVRKPLLQAFPFPSTLGEVTLHLLSLACMLVCSSLGKWVLPPLLWSFPPSATLTSFPTPVAGRVTPLPLEPLRPGPACLFTVPGRIPLPPLQHSVHPTLFATCLYFSYCLLLSFSFFPGWGSVCPGAYAVLAQGCLWEYRVPLSSPCPCLPKLSGHGRLAAQGPSWFLHLT
jgi:hypothetical protein